MRVLIVEDEPCMTAAIRDGLRQEATAAGIVASGSGRPMLVLRRRAHPAPGTGRAGGNHA